MKILNKPDIQQSFMQFIRFSITGVLAALVHFSLVVCIVEMTHLKPITANIYGFLGAFVLSFSGHHSWTFSKTKRPASHTLPRFFLVAVLGFVGNQSFYYFLLTKFQMEYTSALILVLGCIALATFFISKWWAFPSC